MQVSVRHPGIADDQPGRVRTRLHLCAAGVSSEQRHVDPGSGGVRSDGRSDLGRQQQRGVHAHLQPEQPTIGTEPFLHLSGAMAIPALGLSHHPVPLTITQQAQQRPLQRPGWVVVHPAPTLSKLGDQVCWRHQPPQPHARAESLGNCPQIDDAGRVELRQGRQRRHVITELGVVVVLEDNRVPTRGLGEQFEAPRHRQQATERMLV